MNYVPVRLRVNDEEHSWSGDPRKLLSDFLREDLGLTSVHVGCEQGACGACTVLINGLAVKSCVMFAVQADDLHVTTIEGLGRTSYWEPLQQMFHEHHALQCGFCTPGMLITAYEFLMRNLSPTGEEIREAIDGNLCRCTGYANIIRAVAAAASLIRAEKAYPT